MTIQQVIELEGSGYAMYGSCTEATATVADASYLQYPGIIYYAQRTNAPMYKIDVCSPCDAGRGGGLSPHY